MADTASELVIEEQSGARRTIILRGAGLPFAGAAWPAAQRVVTTWYPGNAAQATQHVLGPVERASSWQGEWNTTRLLRSPCVIREEDIDTQIVVADDLRLAVEDLLRKGALLKVTWASRANEVQGDRKIVRLGRATEWSFQYDRIDDIGWSITFEWMSRGPRQQRTIEIDEDAANDSQLFALSSNLKAIEDSAFKAKMIASRRSLPNSANQFTLGQLEQLVDAPRRLMREFAQAATLLNSRANYLGDIIRKMRGLPFEIAGQAADVAANTIAVANNFIDAMSRTPPEQMDARQSFASVTRNASYYGDGVRQANYTARSARDARVAYERSSQGLTTATGAEGRGGAPTGRVAGLGDGKPLAVYLTREGDTLIGVSIKFYGNEGGVAHIAQSNGLRLTTTVLPVGRVLYIPQLTGQSGTILQAPNPLATGVAQGAVDPSVAGGLTPAQGAGPAIIPPGIGGP